MHRTCEMCGAAIQPDDRYCPSCGGVVQPTWEATWPTDETRSSLSSASTTMSDRTGAAEPENDFHPLPLEPVRRSRSWLPLVALGALVLVIGGVVLVFTEFSTGEESPDLPVTPLIPVAGNVTGISVGQYPAAAEIVVPTATMALTPTVAPAATMAPTATVAPTEIPTATVAVAVTTPVPSQVATPARFDEQVVDALRRGVTGLVPSSFDVPGDGTGGAAPAGEGWPTFEPGGETSRSHWPATR